jgi:hypothetical protein
MNKTHEPHNGGLSTKDKRLAAIILLPLSVFVVVIGVSSIISEKSLLWDNPLFVGFFGIFSCLEAIIPHKYHNIKRLTNIAGGICVIILIFSLIRQLIG